MYTKLYNFTLILFTLVIYTAQGKSINAQGALDNGLEAVEETLDLGDANDLGNKVTIEGSNMPTSWQVAAAEALKLAYEFQTNDEGRIPLFISLFTEIHPEFQWNAVVNYQHLYYIATYYIRLRSSNDGDTIFVFSSNS